MAGTRRYLAVDLGASSGRVVLGEWDGSRFALSEIHRFPNGPVRIQDGLYSDVLGLWREINEGIARASRTCGGQLNGVGLDTLGRRLRSVGQGRRSRREPFRAPPPDHDS
jgi:rhamnulokinase